MHDRRLWADVQRRPDELGRYVVWDLHPGSYDLHLERRRRERAVHDPQSAREWPWDEEYLATLERAVGEVA